MDILCVATSVYNDPFAQEWHPNLRYTVSFLRQHNIDAGFIYLPVLDRPARLIQHCGGVKPDTIFFDLTEENYDPLLRFLTAFHRTTPETRIMVGGIPATLTSEELLQRHEEISFIVAGERELTLLEAIKTLKEGRSLHDVLGLQSRDFRNPPRPLMTDLDALGNMIHDGLPAMLAGRDPEERVGYIISSRGCYANCSFCSIPTFYSWSRGKAWRGRSVQAVVDELRELVDKFQIRYFVFQDDNFIGPGRAGQERARQIATEILHSGLGIQYSMCCRLNDIRADTLELMKTSGLSGVGISVESASQESLDLLGKGINAETIYPTLQLLEKLQLPCQVNLIFFDPYITLEGVRRNLALVEYLRSSDYLSYSDAFPFNELKPFPWSRVSARLRLEGLLVEETYTCRFRDPAVAQLAAFVQRLRQHIPLTFKKRLLFQDLDSLSQLPQDTSTLDALMRLSAALRHWVGLALLPRFLAAACDVLENNEDNVQEEFSELEKLFEKEAERLRVLERRVYDALLTYMAN